MKVFKKLIYSLLSIIFIVFINITNIQAKEDVEIEVSYGLDGVIREREPITIVVEVNNKKDEELEGNIEIIVPDAVGTKSSFNENITVGNNARKTFYIPVDIGRLNEKIIINLKSDNNVICTKETMISKGALIMQSWFVVGVLSDNYSEFEHLDDFGSESDESMRIRENSGRVPDVYIKRTKTTKLVTEVLESNIKNLNTLNAIIINDFDTSKLSEKAIKNLNLWINNGGTLILGGTENTINNFPKEILDQSIQDYKNKWVKLNDEMGLSLDIGTLNGDIAEEETKYGTDIIALKYRRNTGRIIVTTFNLGSEKYKESEFKYDMLYDILKDKTGSTDGQFNLFSSYDGNLDTALKTMSYTKDFPIKNIIIIFIIYILSIGFGGYFILKKLDKREYLWLLIPILSVVFTVVIKNVTDESSINDMIQLEVHKVNIDEDGNGEIESYLSVANKYKKDITITEPLGTTMQYAEVGNFFGAQDMLGRSSDIISYKSTYDGVSTKYEFNNVSALEFKVFNLIGKKDKFSKVNGTLKYEDSSITGRITNNLGSDTLRSYIIFGDMVWEVGKLSKGESFDFNKVKPIYNNGLSGFYDKLIYNGYYDYSLLEKNKENENILKLMQISQLGVKGINRKELTIVSITNDSIDYGLSFNSDNIMKISNTVYVNQLNLDLTNNEGDIKYPTHMIDKSVNSKSNNLYYDINKISGEGEVVLEYTLPERFRVKGIKINIPEGDKFHVDKENMIQNPTYNKGAKIYNYATEKFEDITIKQEEPITIKNLDDFIKDGAFKIKYFGNNEGVSNLPEVSVIGRYKDVNN